MTTPLLYLSPAEADLLLANREDAAFWSKMSGEAKLSVLSRAGRMLDEVFQWKGIPVSDEQTLRWPRKNVVDSDGIPVASGKIPDAIRIGVCEQALYLADPDRIKTEKMIRSGVRNASLGAISVSLDTTGESYPVSRMALNAVIALGRIRGNIVGLNEKVSTAGILFRG